MNLYLLLLLPVLLPILAAPIGVPIMGHYAIQQIRRSGGRIYGLSLAVFDLLLFPLLALDGLIFYVLHTLTGDVKRSGYLAVALLICYVFDWLIAWAVWRAVNKPLGNAMHSRPFASAQPIRGAGVWKVALAVILALAITLGVFLYAMFRPAVPPKHETIDLGGGVKMEFVLIPPGTFTMGSDIGLPSEYVDEKPAHKVTITKPFYLGKFEVTQEQWESVMGNNPSQFKGPKLPVETVSWDDCQDFLAELRKKTGRQFALPTEAQWEYACRAGSTTLYGFGESEVDLADYAWFAGNSEGRTHPVGEKKPNRWGLHDMHGNVSEWCADWYSLYASSVALVDPQGPPSGQLHVIRGGAWPQFPNGLRSSNRAGDRRGYRRGFRCVMSVGETTATRRDPYGDQAPRMLVRQTAASGGDPYRDQALGRASLEGKPLPDLGNVGLALDAAPIGKPLLLCLLDAEQRPSRHVARLLAERHDALNQKGVAVLAVQVAAASTESLREWTNSTPIPFPVGSVAEKTAANKWATSVTSLPWFILRDANGTVTAEGFALDELSTKMEALRK